MIQLKFDAQAFSDRIHRTLENVKEVQRKMETEMIDWQSQDMRRKRPFLVKENNPASVATKIWPRSRFEILKRQRSWAKERKGRRTSTRPILRQILVVKLVERMKRMFRETMTWR
jgi:hypothetical protein